MSIESLIEPASDKPPRAGARRAVPRPFFLGTLALYLIILGTYLLNASPLHFAIPNWRTIVPLLAGFSFLLLASLFVVILGRGYISRWVVLLCIGVTFVLTSILCLMLRARLLHDAMDPSREQLRAVGAAIAHGVQVIFSGRGLLAEMLQFIGMIMVEEGVKLLPVFIGIALGRIRSAHAAMLCGALSGLTFGTVEAIAFGYLEYPMKGDPITHYLTRFLVMSPMHGVWDALAGGLVFFLSGATRSSDRRRPGAGAYAAAFACAAVFHVLHNALQARFGAVMQIVTVFAFLAPLYLMARATRRRLVDDGHTTEQRVFGDLHLLALSMATVFMAASVWFSWAMGLTLNTPPPPASESAVTR